MRWNPGHSVRPIWDSAGCTFIPELMFTLGLEPSTVHLEHHRAIHLVTQS
ncbi:unnamed protein product [Schistosoma margrebowiei]|uniref:Uncharacterized protein n=1 Tax=Schistosoma margrebowiei TaxID=48269 RepID=A0A3P8BF59_9TREM|nr:unnamed protein product [Schistosoma margrebowiei]